MIIAFRGGGGLSAGGDHTLLGFFQGSKPSTDYNAKKLNSFWCTVAEKILRNSQNQPFLENLPFLGGFPDFLSNGTTQSAEIFWVRPGASF